MAEQSQPATSPVPGAGARVELNPADRSLDCQLSDRGTTAETLSKGGFGYLWSGVRATHGIVSGRYWFSVRLLEHSPEAEDSCFSYDEELGAHVDTVHCCRVGVSRRHAQASHLGRKGSWALCGIGKIIQGNTYELTPFAQPLRAGDEVAVFVDLQPQGPHKAAISFSINSQPRFEAFRLWQTQAPDPACPDSALFPHLAIKNITVAANFSGDRPWHWPADKPWDGTWDGFLPWQACIQRSPAPVRGPRCRPLQDCEVILMVGLPSSGKTHQATSQLLPKLQGKPMQTGSRTVLHLPNARQGPADLLASGALSPASGAAQHRQQQQQQQHQPWQQQCQQQQQSWVILSPEAVINDMKVSGLRRNGFAAVERACELRNEAHVVFEELCQRAAQHSMNYIIDCRDAITADRRQERLAPFAAAGFKLTAAVTFEPDEIMQRRVARSQELLLPYPDDFLAMIANFSLPDAEEEGFDEIKYLGSIKNARQAAAMLQQQQNRVPEYQQQLALAHPNWPGSAAFMLAFFSCGPITQQYPSLRHQTPPYLSAGSSCSSSFSDRHLQSTSSMASTQYSSRAVSRGYPAAGSPGQGLGRGTTPYHPAEALYLPRTPASWVPQQAQMTPGTYCSQQQSRPTYPGAEVLQRQIHQVMHASHARPAFAGGAHAAGSFDAAEAGASWGAVAAGHTPALGLPGAGPDMNRCLTSSSFNSTCSSIVPAAMTSNSSTSRQSSSVWSAVAAAVGSTANSAMSLEDSACWPTLDAAPPGRWDSSKHRPGKHPKQQELQRQEQQQIRPKQQALQQQEQRQHPQAIQPQQEHHEQQQQKKNRQQEQPLFSPDQQQHPAQRVSPFACVGIVPLPEIPADVAALPLLQPQPQQQWQISRRTSSAEVSLRQGGPNLQLPQAVQQELQACQVTCFSPSSLLDAVEGKGPSGATASPAGKGSFGRVYCCRLSDLQACSSSSSSSNGTDVTALSPAESHVAGNGCHHDAAPSGAAANNDDGELVAVKVLSLGKHFKPKALLDELLILARCRHPHIVSLKGYCLPHRALVFDYLPNGTLKDWLDDDCYFARGRKLSWRQRLDIALQVAEALVYLHSLPEPVVHRDVKPDNILLAADCSARLADVGLAKLMPTNASHVSSCTRGNFILVAPEYSHLGVVSTAMDVYAFGLLLACLVSGDAENPPTHTLWAMAEALGRPYAADAGSSCWLPQLGLVGMSGAHTPTSPGGAAAAGSSSGAANGIMGLAAGGRHASLATSSYWWHRVLASCTGSSGSGDSVNNVNNSSASSPSKISSNSSASPIDASICSASTSSDGDRHGSDARTSTSATAGKSWAAVAKNPKFGKAAGPKLSPGCAAGGMPQSPNKASPAHKKDSKTASESQQPNSITTLAAVPAESGAAAATALGPSCSNAGLHSPGGPQPSAAAAGGVAAAPIVTDELKRFLDEDAEQDKVVGKWPAHVAMGLSCLAQACADRQRHMRPRMQDVVQVLKRLQHSSANV